MQQVLIASQLHCVFVCVITIGYATVHGNTGAVVANERRGLPANLRVSLNKRSSGYSWLTRMKVNLNMINLEVIPASCKHL